jgi:hypothetical protein
LFSGVPSESTSDQTGLPFLIEVIVPGEPTMLIVSAIAEPPSGAQPHVSAHSPFGTSGATGIHWLF